MYRGGRNKGDVCRLRYLLHGEHRGYLLWFRGNNAAPKGRGLFFHKDCKVDPIGVEFHTTCSFRRCKQGFYLSRSKPAVYPSFGSKIIVFDYRDKVIGSIGRTAKHFLEHLEELLDDTGLNSVRNCLRMNNSYGVGVSRKEQIATQLVPKCYHLHVVRRPSAGYGAGRYIERPLLRDGDFIPS